MEVRHCCFSSSRMAEINVPAWPIPIHHTKLVMANPQATGIMTPHSPTPMATRSVTVRSSNMASTKLMPKPIHQPSLRRGLRTNPSTRSAIES